MGDTKQGKDIREEIESDALRLEEKIRDYCRSQKETWRKVPYLALMADGRRGFSDQYAGAYGGGYWVIYSSEEEGYYHAAVDLETGEIVDTFSVSGDTFYTEEGEIAIECPFDESSLAERKYVFNLAEDLDELDAAAIVMGLENEANKPYSDSYTEARRKEIESWREEILMNKKISQSYTRDAR